MKQHYRRLTAVLLLAGLLLGMSACGGATQDNTAFCILPAQWINTS